MDGKEEVEADQLITQLSFFIIYLILFLFRLILLPISPNPLRERQ
jgi:hypothetical protein